MQMVARTFVFQFFLQCIRTIQMFLQYSKSFAHRKILLTLSRAFLSALQTDNYDISKYIFV